jgi:predicted aldo/keto reductase-like oxidoreductase
MDALIAELNTKLSYWQPAVAEQVRHCILEIIEMADQDVLDILRIRTVEQEVFDFLDKPTNHVRRKN